MPPRTKKNHIFFKLLDTNSHNLCFLSVGRVPDKRNCGTGLIFLHLPFVFLPFFTFHNCPLFFFSHTHWSVCAVTMSTSTGRGANRNPNQKRAKTMPGDSGCSKFIYFVRGAGCLTTGIAERACLYMFLSWVHLELILEPTGRLAGRCTVALTAANRKGYRLAPVGEPSWSHLGTILEPCWSF